MKTQRIKLLKRVFVIGVEYSLDGRLAAAKTIKKLGYAIEFTAQDSSKLTDWIAKRFAALGKTDARFATLDALVKKANGLWCAEAEAYLLENF